jgi:hypothetical protein
VDDGALCVTISLQQRQQGLLVDNLDSPEATSTIIMLVLAAAVFPPLGESSYQLIINKSGNFRVKNISCENILR